MAFPCVLHAPRHPTNPVPDLQRPLLHLLLPARLRLLDHLLVGGKAKGAEGGRVWGRLKGQQREGRGRRKGQQLPRGATAAGARGGRGVAVPQRAACSCAPVQGDKRPQVGPRVAAASLQHT